MQTDRTAVGSWARMLPLFVLILVWQFSVLAIPSVRFFLSTPVDILSTLWRVAASGEIFAHAGVTLFEVVAGFLTGTGFGTALGLALWFWPAAARIAGPYIVALGAVPVFAIAPVVIFWFGIGVSAKIAVAFLSTFFVSLTQAYEGAQSADERHLRLIRILGGDRRQEFIKVVVPTAVQWVIASARLNIGFALAGAFIGEFIASERGLGFFIVRAAGLYDMSRVLAGCLVLMVIALGLSAAVSALERRLSGKKGDS